MPRYSEFLPVVTAMLKRRADKRIGRDWSNGYLLLQERSSYARRLDEAT